MTDPDSKFTKIAEDEYIKGCHYFFEDFGLKTFVGKAEAVMFDTTSVMAPCELEINMYHQPRMSRVFRWRTSIFTDMFQADFVCRYSPRTNKLYTSWISSLGAGVGLLNPGETLLFGTWNLGHDAGFFADSVLDEIRVMTPLERLKYGGFDD